jgi:hypothetical protein
MCSENVPDGVIYNVLSTEDGKDMVGDGGGALYKTVRK